MLISIAKRASLLIFEVRVVLLSYGALLRQIEGEAVTHFLCRMREDLRRFSGAVNVSFLILYSESHHLDLICTKLASVMQLAYQTTAVPYSIRKITLLLIETLYLTPKHFSTPLLPLCLLYLGRLAAGLLGQGEYVVGGVAGGTQTGAALGW